MNDNPRVIALPRDQRLPGNGGDSLATAHPEVKRVLRNTYALLSLTLLFSASVAAARIRGAALGSRRSTSRAWRSASPRLPYSASVKAACAA